MHSDLLALIDELRREVAALRKENQRLRERIDVLEGRSPGPDQKSPTTKLDEPYSLRSEESRERQRISGKSGRKKQRRKQKSARRGRIATQEKVDQADQVELVLPDGFDIGQCRFVRERPVWRIVDWRAVRVVYEIWCGPNGEQRPIEGVLPRCEYGIEIHTSLAFLTLIIGLSIDKVCGLMKYFWQLELSKSQADALLNQLAAEWESEFESLCQLLAVSAVVHTDETSWSINSVWAFLSEKVRLLIFGCHKDGDTLASLLSKGAFGGVIVSDDAAVYRGFSTVQKCWAHLLRQAIRLTLLEPHEETYRAFLDELLDVYRSAKRASADKRLNDTGRQQRVDELANRMCHLCGDRHADESIPATEAGKDYYNLVHELVRLMSDDELFTFVRHPKADGTNNEAERSLRGAASDRRTGRTSKTSCGARRRTILVSVFESLRLHLSEFTHTSVQAEVQHWQRSGRSLFTRLLESTGLAPPRDSILDQIVPAG